MELLSVDILLRLLHYEQRKTVGFQSPFLCKLGPEISLFVNMAEGLLNEGDFIALAKSRDIQNHVDCASRMHCWAEKKSLHMLAKRGDQGHEITVHHYLERLVRLSRELLAGSFIEPLPEEGL